MEWLRAGGASVDANITLSTSSNGRRGVFASAKLPADSVVVSVPASMILTPDESAAADALREMGLGPEEFESPRLEREALVRSTS
jgi:hypothetical protein